MYSRFGLKITFVLLLEYLTNFLYQINYTTLLVLFEMRRKKPSTVKAVELIRLITFVGILLVEFTKTIETLLRDRSNSNEFNSHRF
jgi:hypothetical protein